MRSDTSNSSRSLTTQIRLYPGSGRYPSGEAIDKQNRSHALSDIFPHTVPPLNMHPLPPQSSWIEIASPFAGESGRVLLLEPPSIAQEGLRAQLLDGSYAKPFIIDDGVQRTLYFTLRLIQSVMRLATPDALDLRYSQKMMSFLLFNPAPQRIVLIGLGGGSLLKFCHHRLPDCHFTAVECDPHVIAWREAFRLPPDGPRLQILHADGAAYLAQAVPGIDVLLVDAFDENGIPPRLATPDFLEQAAARLSACGMLLMNLSGDQERYAGLIGRALQVFETRVIIMSVRDDGNQVLLAFKDPHFAANWRSLHDQARALQARLGLDFPAFSQKLERSHKLGLARREALRGH